ncbi:Translin-associated protein X [Vitis vinifera]|uniref:Translin-associated protein X n=1 Tax=Vitis vinifera TaxID=29760 RepID=A0A438E9Z7_VITVI|nr:Translin-associated protein X [Vitis vinifera]
MFYSAAFYRLFLMAPKPHRFPQDTVLQSPPKRARTMATESSIKDAFANYTDYLNLLMGKISLPIDAALCGAIWTIVYLGIELFLCPIAGGLLGGTGKSLLLSLLHICGNEKRERVVKASRDITINSKKVIFQVHRISKNNKDEVLDKAVKDLASVTEQHVSRLVKELQGTDFWKLRRAYSPGVQEYVEAATLCNFCKNGTLLILDEINATLLPLSDPSHQPLQINILDYLLGLADLTGELMRLAIGRISDGELEYAEKICGFVRDIYRELTLLAPHMDDNTDMKTKMDTMLQSVMKIENGYFSFSGNRSRKPLLDDQIC